MGGIGSAGNSCGKAASNAMIKDKKPLETMWNKYRKKRKMGPFYFLQSRGIEIFLVPRGKERESIFQLFVSEMVVVQLLGKTTSIRKTVDPKMIRPPSRIPGSDCNQGIETVSIGIQGNQVTETWIVNMKAH
jgi:hypothetical protein